MREHTVTKLRQLLESDRRLRELEHEAAKATLNEALQEEYSKRWKEHTAWHKPDTDEESDEIRDRAKDLGVDHDKLRKGVEKGKVAPLSRKHWKSLENTDSWGTKKMKQVKELSKEYGKDYKSVKKGYKKGHSMPAPMIVHRKGKNPYLVGGNTRLMVARAKRIKPHAVHVDLDDSLLESDTRIRKLEKAFTEDPGDKDVGKALEKAYYQTGDYINARKTKLAYDPYRILIAQTSIIPPQGFNAPLRIVLYLLRYKNGRAEFVIWTKNEQSGGTASGDYRDSLRSARRDFIARISRHGGSHQLDRLPDGHPTSWELYDI